MGIVILLVQLVILVAVLAGMWKLFIKFGAPGWVGIVPFYNAWVLVKLLGKEPIWFIGLFIPVVNIVVGILLAIEVAKGFGKSTLFAVGIVLLGFIFIPMLGFGSAEWQGEKYAA
jgi:hypothetical protein